MCCCYGAQLELGVIVKRERERVDLKSSIAMDLVFRVGLDTRRHRFCSGQVALSCSLSSILLARILRSVSVCVCVRVVDD